MKRISLIVLILPLIVLQAIQAADIADLKLSDLIVNSAFGLCYKCISQNTTAFFFQGTPACSYNGYVPPSFANIKTKQCYNLGEYYSYGVQFCTGYVVDYYDCLNQCTETNPDKNLMIPNKTYTLAANTRCQYLVSISKSLTTSLTQYTVPLVRPYSSSLFFSQKPSKYTEYTSNSVYNSKNVSSIGLFTNASYVMVMNLGSTSLNFTTDWVNVTVIAEPTKNTTTNTTTNTTSNSTTNNTGSSNSSTNGTTTNTTTNSTTTTDVKYTHGVNGYDYYKMQSNDYEDLINQAELEREALKASSRSVTLQLLLAISLFSISFIQYL